MDDVKKRDYVNALSSGVYQIFFVKRKGKAARYSICTLIPQFIPKKMQDIYKEVMMLPRKTSNKEVVVAYDLEKQSWISFSPKNVIVFKKLKSLDKQIE